MASKLDSLLSAVTRKDNIPRKYVLTLENSFSQYLAVPPQMCALAPFHSQSRGSEQAKSAGLLGTFFRAARGPLLGLSTCGLSLCPCHERQVLQRLWGSLAPCKYCDFRKLEAGSSSSITDPSLLFCPVSLFCFPSLFVIYLQI